jgi:hypothetical protein
MWAAELRALPICERTSGSKPEMPNLRMGQTPSPGRAVVVEHRPGARSAVRKRRGLTASGVETMFPGFYLCINVGVFPIVPSPRNMK